MWYELLWLCATREIEDFQIPELPCGQNMVINIRTTWGDQHYVGLSGIEIFSNTGEPVSVAKVCMWYVLLRLFAN